jgi:hypothetical protein
MPNLIARLKAHPKFMANARPVMTPNELRATEKTIDAALPSFLRTLYLEVGNGGFAPDIGLMGGVNGHPDDMDNTIVDRYQLMRSEPVRYPWPVGLVDVLHWGCACYTAIDCRSAEGTMVFYDPGHFENTFDSAEAEKNGEEPIRSDPTPALRLHADSLEQWYEDWLGGRLNMGYDKPLWSRRG